MTKKVKSILIILFLASAFGVPLTGCGDHPAGEISYSLFQADSGWGYNILVGENIFIHQDRIPGIPEEQAFKSQNQAKIAAELVILKIKEKKSPALSKEEVKKIMLNEK